MKVIQQCCLVRVLDRFQSIIFFMVVVLLHNVQRSMYLCSDIWRRAATNYGTPGNMDRKLMVLKNEVELQKPIDQ